MLEIWARGFDPCAAMQWLQRLECWFSGVDLGVCCGRGIDSRVGLVWNPRKIMLVLVGEWWGIVIVVGIGIGIGVFCGDLGGFWSGISDGSEEILFDDWVICVCNWIRVFQWKGLLNVLIRFFLPLLVLLLLFGAIHCWVLVMQHECRLLKVKLLNHVCIFDAYVCYLLYFVLCVHMELIPLNLCNLRKISNVCFGFRTLGVLWIICFTCITIW